MNVNRELTYNVYEEDFNRKEIVVRNIFTHQSFYDSLVKIKKECKDDFAAFSDRVQKSLMYYYWSKCEYEIILSGWPPKDDFKQEKVDIYSQVMLNWDIFIQYLWGNKNLIKTRK